jgi:hypothetical protein
MRLPEPSRPLNSDPPPHASTGSPATTSAYQVLSTAPRPSLTANPSRGLAGRVNGRIFPHRHCRPRELPELEKNRPPEPPFRAYK